MSVAVIIIRQPPETAGHCIRAQKRDYCCLAVPGGEAAALGPVGSGRPEARKDDRKPEKWEGNVGGAKRAMQVLLDGRCNRVWLKGAASNNGSRWKSGRGCMVKVSLVRRLVRRARQMWATRSNAVIFGNIYENRLRGVASDPEAPFQRAG